MRLIHLLTLRLSLVATLVLALWAVLFYHAIMAEVNDEQDDALEDYAEMVMRRFLCGEQLPADDSGTNNQYYLRPVTVHYATTHPHVRYRDHDVYIRMKEEYEPARSIYYIFQDKDDHFYEVSVSVPTIDKDDLNQALLWLMVLLFGILLLSHLAISMLMVGRTMKPLSRLLAWMNAYRPGGDNVPLDNPTRVTEFAQMNRSVRQLTERSEGFERQQQLFISNASHEIQTPLAICIGRLETLLEDDALPAEQAREVGKTLGTLGNLSQLNRSLLMLSRIDKGQYSDDQPIDLLAVVRDHLPDYEELFAAKALTVDAVLDGALTVKADKHLANTAVLNLLKNAFVHSPAGGTLRLRGDARALRLSNTATGGALDSGKIFLPFYHDASKSRSTGLGLALVAAVCRRYGWILRYVYEPGWHCFELRVDGNDD